MKVIIAGGRDFNNYESLAIHCDGILVNQTNVEIVSGGQVTHNKKTNQLYGADYLGEKYARSVGLPVKVFPADWGKHGRAAGPIRNRQMAEYADALIAFWDGKSAGTKNMIKEAEKRNLKIRVIRY